MSEFIYLVVVVLVGIGSVIWAESIPTDRELMLKDKRIQVRIRKG